MRSSRYVLVTVVLCASWLPLRRARAQEDVPDEAPQPAAEEPAEPPELAPQETVPPAPEAEEDAPTAPEPSAEAPAEAPSDVLLAFEPGDGLQISTRDDQFSMNIRPRVQLLGAVSIPDDGGDASLGVSIRRARLTFSGHFFGEDNRYKLQLAFSPSDLRVDSDTGMPTVTPLLDYYLEFRQLRELNVRVGQYVLQFNRVRVISSGETSMVDRSITNGEINLDRDLALMIYSRDFLGAGWFRYYASISTGEGRDAGFGTDFGMVYLARVEFLPLGMFEDYDEVDLARSEEPGLSIGLSYAYLDEAPRIQGIMSHRPADGGTTDYHAWAADAMFKYAGLTAQLEMVGRYGWRNPGGALDDMGNPIPVELPRNGLGWFAQVSYLLPGVDLDVQARYGMNIPIGDDTETGFGDQRELGAGVAYYFAGHPFKIHLDYFHLWNGDTFDQGTERIRLQLQGSL